MSNIIKTSLHNINHLNMNKNSNLSDFLNEYNNITQYFVDYLWNNKITYVIKNKKYIFDIKNDMLDLPNMLSSKIIKYDKCNLSERAIKCSITQAIGIVKSKIKKRKSLLYVKNKLQNEKKCTKYIDSQLDKEILKKPNINNINAELNSICCKFEKSNQITFDGVITLKSIGKKFGKIIIPINFNKHSNKIKANLKPSFLISKDKIHFRWESPKAISKSEGKIVGIDTGIKKVALLSDGSPSATIDNHGHTLTSILKKIVRRKKGSKSFKKALEQRNNFINFSINKINFSNIKQINLEEISNFRYNKNVGKFLNYFPEGLIKKKIEDKAIEHGVRVQLQDSSYRSQRCSSCGYVHKSNRNKEIFKCKKCGYKIDSDYNASCNHEQALPSAEAIRRSRLGNKKEGFYWIESGFYDLNGSELAVPDTKKGYKLL